MMPSALSRILLASTFAHSLSLTGRVTFFRRPVTVLRVYSSPDAVSRLANRSTKTWTRLGPVIQLAIDSPATCQTAVDVGCDHGLVALSLAVSGRFQRVIGTDVSLNALSNAEALRDEYLRHTEGKCNQDIPLDLLCGPGLSHLLPGQADVIALAGMGVSTMQEILADGHLDRMKCQQLVLQPTTSRPRNLMNLYDDIVSRGWSLRNENIIYLNRRWYITSSFLRVGDEKYDAERKTETKIMPGAILSTNADGSAMRQTFENYVMHHKEWLLNDEVKSRVPMRESDRRWIDRFSFSESN